jgi:capsular exopolysaccharide synthesis family protein
MANLHAGKDHASLADFLQILRLRLGLIALILALVVITAMSVTAFLPKWYLATTKIRVEKPEGEVKLFQAQSTNSYDPYFLQDQFKIMQSEKILYPVITKLGLNKRLAPELGSPAALPDWRTYRYLVDKMLRIESQRSSSLIEINVFAQDGQLAADIANEIAKTYEEDRISLATSVQDEGFKRLKLELVKQEQAVTRQRDAVEKLRNDLSISGVDLNARYTDMEIENLRQMQNTLIALRVDAIGRRTRWERFKSIPMADRLALVNSELIPDQNIQNLLQAYLAADQKVTQLKSQQMAEAHPQLISAVDNRAKIKEQLESQLHGYETSLEIGYKEADARVAELERQLDKAKVGQILSARERMRPFEEAWQKLEDENRLLTTLKLTLRQREIDFQVPKKTIEILNTAEPARVPSKPNWTLNAVFAFLFGGVFAVGVAVMLEYFDTSFRNVGDVETRLRLPVLGVIPFTSDPLGASEDPAEVEPFRVLHTNLNLTQPPGTARALVIFSAGPGEGKSTTLHRLARLMGENGERTILIDSDLRRPTQHRLAERPKEPGLSDLLLGQKTLDEVIQKQISPGLDFIASGSTGGFSLSLIYGNRLREIIGALKGRYDKIVFDSPPIIGVSDASVLITAVDGAVLLIQYRRNPQSMVLRAQQIVDSLKIPLIGVVLNQVPANAGGEYSYYTANYAYYSDQAGGRRRRSAKTAAAPEPGAKPAPATPEKDRLVLREPDRD